MSAGPTKQFAELFPHSDFGDREALDKLLPAAYEELRRVARYHLRQQRPNHTLQTTALVHEAYLRLANGKKLTIENRAHFLGIAAQLMRWILVDYERSRGTSKRGAGAAQLTLEMLSAMTSAPGPQVDLLLLDSALDKLAKLDALQSKIVELRYFAGLSIEDTAESLGISTATVKRSWSSARVWLIQEMNQKQA